MIAVPRSRVEFDSGQCIIVYEDAVEGCISSISEYHIGYHILLEMKIAAKSM